MTLYLVSDLKPYSWGFRSAVVCAKDDREAIRFVNDDLGSERMEEDKFGVVVLGTAMSTVEAGVIVMNYKE